MKEQVKTIIYLATIIFVFVVIATRLAQSTDVTGINYFVVENLSVGGDVHYQGSIGGIPADGVLLFTTSCPSGWTRLSAADGSYIRFGGTPGATGGSATHTHTYTHSHTHTLTTSSSGGSHTHTFSDTTASVSSHTHDWTGTNDEPYNVSGSLGFLRETTDNPSGSGGSHSHSIGPFTSASAGSSHTHTLGALGDASPSIVAANNDPPYVDFVLCKK